VTLLFHTTFHSEDIASGDINSVSSPNLKLVPIVQNLVDKVWSSDQPPRPSNHIVPLGKDICGEAWQDKVKALQTRIKEAEAVGYFITKLDEVACKYSFFNKVEVDSSLAILLGLFNMRGT
jgi:hypothetical protein